MTSERYPDPRGARLTLGSPGTQKRHCHEGLDPDVVDRLAEDGVRYVGSDTTHVYCLPTCRHARRITDRHRVAFADRARAESAGYRPCLVCRPVAA